MSSEAPPPLQPDHASNDIQLSASVRPQHSPKGAARIADRGVRMVAIGIEDQDAQCRTVTAHHATCRLPC